jgi:hypothetical protein
MPGDIPIAQAFVHLESDDTGLASAMLASIKRAQAAMPPLSVKIVPDLAGFQVALKTALASAMAATGGKITVPLDVQADTNSIDTAIRLIKQRMLTQGLADFLDVSLPLGRVQYQISLLKRMLQQGGLTDFLGVSLRPDQVLTSAEALKAAVQRELGNVNIGVGLSPGDAAAEAAAAKAAAVAALGGGASETITEQVGVGGVPEATASLAALNAALAATRDEAAAAGGSGGIGGLGLVAAAAGGWFGGLSQHVTLFGGALGKIPLLGTVTGFHILADSVLEIGATLIPAAVAFGAFGVGSIDTVMEIVSHIQDLDKANDELGGTIYPLTGGFTKLAAAVKPEVYTLFGEGLVLVSKNAGLFTTIATGAGTVLEQLGARFVYATTQGAGFGGFLKNAVADLAGWGDLIGNIGGIIGNFFKAMPGYAEILLGLADGITHVIEVTTGAIIPVINLGLALHGAVLYLGLAATAGTWLITGVLGLLARGATAAAGAIEGLGAAGALAATGLDSVAGAATITAALPWGWILTAVAGLTLLAIQFGKIKTAAQAFNATVEQTIQNAPLLSLQTTIMSAQAETAAKLAAAQANLAATEKQTGDQADYAAGRFAASNQRMYEAATAAKQYAQGGQQISAVSSLVSQRVAALGQKYGGTKDALALLNAAGITSGQITDTNNQHWQEALIQIQGQNNALVALTGTTGRYKAALNALSGPEQYLGDMLHSIQDIAQAQDAMLANMVQGQGALDTFEEGISTLGSNLGTADGKGASFTDTLGKLSDKASLVGAALGGTSLASYNLNQAFYDAATNGQKIIDALEEQEVSTQNLQTATATISKQMLGYAGNNTAARATIVAMINDALGPQTVSLQTLNGWVKKNSTSLGGLNAIIDDGTISAGQLSNVLSSQLNVTFHETLLETSGADAQLKDYTADLVHNSENTQSGQSTRAQLIKDLMNAGDSAQQAAQYVNSLSTALGRVPTHIYGQVTVKASGSGSVDWGTTAPFTGLPSKGALQFFAGGGMVSGGTPGRDSVLIAAMPGEAIVPQHLVGAVAPILKAGGVPGFASGGPISQSGLNAPGNYVSQITSTAMGALGQDLETAVIAAAKAALAQPNLSYPAGPTGGAQYALEMYAASLFPTYGWAGNQILPLGALWERESGWNRFALNPSSGAYGIAQALPPTKYPPAGQAAGGSSAAAQIAWGESYIAQRYGTPAGAWAHELSAGWYDSGGWLMPGASVAVNRTGKAELVSKPDKLDELIAAVDRNTTMVCGAVQTLTGVTAQGPRGMAAAFSGMATQAGAKALYPHRAGASR